MLESRKYYRGEQAQGRLEELGLTEAPLLEAAGYGVARMDECTRFNPATAPGYYLWSEGTRRLRERLVLMGWRHATENGLELVVSQDGKTAICVCQGDASTGTPVDPKTKRARGRASIRVVDVNRGQLELFASSAASNRVLREGGRLTWWLLVYPGEHEIRAELALASEIDPVGYISGWEERIVLSPLPRDPMAEQVGEYESSEDLVDVPIKRIM